MLTQIKQQSFTHSFFMNISGFVYGAKENKKLKVFIDDVNLPVPDEHNVQKCNEVSTANWFIEIG